MADYAFEGQTWSSDVITWSFADSTYPIDASTQFSDSISSAYQATVLDALQRWQGVSGVTFEQVADSPDPSQAADIRIGFGDLPAQQRDWRDRSEDGAGRHQFPARRAGPAGGSGSSIRCSPPPAAAR